MRTISEHKSKRLLAGMAPADDETSQELARFVTEIKAAYPEIAPVPEVEARHMAAMVEAAQLLTDKGDPVERPVSKANGPELQVSGLPKLRRKLVFSNMFTSLGVKVAAPVIATLTAFSGVAYAGGLPDPVQRAVADFAGNLSLDLPNPEEQDLETGVEGPDTEIDEGDQGNLEGQAADPGVGDEGQVGHSEGGNEDSLDDGDKSNLEGNQNDVDDGPAGQSDEGNQNDVDDGPAGQSDEGNQNDDQGGSNEANQEGGSNN